MVMRRRTGRGTNALRQVMGVVLAVAGAAIVFASLPRWLWLLALGVLFLWGGLVLAMGQK